MVFSGRLLVWRIDATVVVDDIDVVVCLIIVMIATASRYFHFSFLCFSFVNYMLRFHSQTFVFRCFFLSLSAFCRRALYASAIPSLATWNSHVRFYIYTQNWNLQFIAQTKERKKNLDVLILLHLLDDSFSLSHTRRHAQAHTAEFRIPNLHMSGDANEIYFCMIRIFSSLSHRNQWLAAGWLL